jgi:hypothetical protein
MNRYRAPKGAFFVINLHRVLECQYHRCGCGSIRVRILGFVFVANRPGSRNASAQCLSALNGSLSILRTSINKCRPHKNSYLVTLCIFCYNVISSKNLNLKGDWITWKNFYQKRTYIYIWEN